jgi:hypothetical protein
MERVKGTPGDGKIQWRKLGRGFFRLPNRIIKPGGVFWARPDEIPMAFRDMLVPIDPKELKEQPKAPARPVRTPIEVRQARRMVRRNPTPEEKKAEEIVDAVKPKYTIVPRSEGGTWFDILDEHGKRMNAKALHIGKAEEFKKSLEE